MGRRDIRKEARLAKNQRKHQAWMEHQKSQKLKRTNEDVKLKHGKKSKGSYTQIKSEENQSLTELILSEEDEVKLNSVGQNESTSSKTEKRKKDISKRARKTKFEEFLQLDVPKASISAEEDLELERKLAKRLKVKNGKMRGEDDGLNVLFEGVPSVFDSSGEEEEIPNAEEQPAKKKPKKRKSLEQGLEGENGGDLMPKSEETNGADVGLEEVPATVASRKRRKKKLSEQAQDNVVSDTADTVSNPQETHDAEVALVESTARAPALESSVKYVPPHLRSRAGNESEEHSQIRRRVRGLLNRLSESNVESITGEMSTIFLSVGRSVGSKIISEEVLASCSSGPRGNEQYAAVFAAFVAGMACLVGIDFSAKLMASLAQSFENEYLKKDNLSLRNLTLLLSYLCIFGVFSSELIYDFLIMLSKRLAEIDVSTILTILQCCGIKIRGDDPTAMKDFILSVQNRVNELKASCGDGPKNINGKRMEFMLETICDIKNNKKRPKEDTVQHTRIKKWLQKLRVEGILIRGLTWSKLLDPDKKGQWWLSRDMAAQTENVVEVARNIDKEVLEAQNMLQLASAMGMNTENRKAIFCIIMTAEDYIDTIEKLLRLDLPAKQDREIIRVLMVCCLHEKHFNKYYTVLASKLCEHDKNHKFTLQYCIWDYFNELESMPLIKSMHLAKFVAEMIACFNLSLGVLKPIDFSNPIVLTNKRIVHFRMLFEYIFECPDNLVLKIFDRIAVNPDLEILRDGIMLFIKEHVVRTNKELASKFKIAKKALKYVQPVLM
ncbi:nucleolar MIF4G domain-containing protein 1-like [Pistacia vera]|uniref:nucleolar MIF4G domain-containing protein 1-like n=1 Tax=Pistacia vera TaxID=55513 RepID=UPI0012631F17|nr:nucleolar MIF4G domain-containing protein 1-like [Pistacia vera]XP_031258610.1 nucleolar MIF4G domain-containing protein 1-like [Pistacia vera]